jgi:hypothetical protein
MVALSLAGIALIRSTDTAGIVAGNLAFKQAAMTALDRSVEAAIHAMWDPSPPITDRAVNNTGAAGQNYFACVQAVAGGCIPAGTSIPQIPDALDPSKFTTAYFTGKGLRTDLLAADSGGNKSYYMIERMCLLSGPAVPSEIAGGGGCNVSVATYGADPGTEHYFGLIRPGDAYYRVTIRVEGPRNTVTYAQAILR